MIGPSRSFIRATKGQLVESGGRTYTITGLMSVDRVMGKDIESGEILSLRIETLRWPTNASDTESSGESGEPAMPASGSGDLNDFQLPEWKEAQRRLEVIKPLLDNPMRTRADLEKMATANNTSIPTLYRWLRGFQQAGQVSGLVPERRGRRPGSKYLKKEQELIISTTIEDVYLTKERRKPIEVIEAVRKRSRLAGIRCPGDMSVRRRIDEIEPAVRLRRRGFKDLARSLHEPIRGSIPGADYPLSMVQIDHARVDVMLVDEVHRLPLERPWLTLATDVFSRMVVGLHLAYEAPSFAAVGFCISMGMCPKQEYLAKLGIDGEWPVWGNIGALHSDNGKEFRCATLARALQNYQIDTQRRPSKIPEYGGNIERLIGTIAAQAHKLPGTTFSNPTQRKGYDSKAESAMTLREYERHLVNFIVNVYHKSMHSRLHMSPERMWEQGIMGTADAPGTGPLPVPSDPSRVYLDFLPTEERIIQSNGIQIYNIFYYDQVLDSYINAPDPQKKKEKRKFTLRIDPRDISKIYFLDPRTKSYFPIPYRNKALPPISAWEHNQVLKKLKEEGRREIDEVAIFNAVDRMRADVESAKALTKEVRRQATRRPPRASEAKAVVLPGSKSVGVNAPVALDDLFAAPAKPFDDSSTSR